MDTSKIALTIMMAMTALFMVAARTGLNSVKHVDVSKLPMVGIVR